LINRTNQDVTESVQTKRLCIIGTQEMASFIESALQGWLPPYPEGIYLPDKLEPVLTAGKPYLLEVIEDLAPVSGQMHYWPLSPSYRYVYYPISSLKDVIGAPWDVVDGMNDNKLVLSHRDTVRASLQPIFPLHGAKIVHDIIHNFVYSKLTYSKIGELKIEDILEPYFIDQAKEMPNIKNHPMLVKISNDLFDTFLDVFQRIKSFMGDNEFMMHDLTLASPLELHLEQKGDFRIYDWTKRMADGTWK